MKYIDIVQLKANIDGGKLRTSLDGLGNIYIEDIQAGESVKIGKLPSAYSFHETGNWEPCFMYTSHSIGRPLAGEDGWRCPVCGVSVKERTDWCTCGADMRTSKARRKELEDLLDKL